MGRGTGALLEAEGGELGKPPAFGREVAEAEGLAAADAAPFLAPPAWWIGVLVM